MRATRQAFRSDGRRDKTGGSQQGSETKKRKTKNCAAAVSVKRWRRGRQGDGRSRHCGGRQSVGSWRQAECMCLDERPVCLSTGMGTPQVKVTSVCLTQGLGVRS